MTKPEDLLNFQYTEGSMKVLDLLPTAVIYIDKEERYLFSNIYYETRYGRKRESTLGFTLRDVLGSDRYSEIEPHVKRALSGERVQFEMLIPREGGTPENCLCIFIPDFNSEGVVLGFAGLAQDVTDYRKAIEALSFSEKRFNSFADSIPQIVWIRENQGDLQYINKAWYEYTGIDPTGLNTVEVHEAIHPQDKDRVVAAWNKAHSDGEPFEIELRLQRRDGVYRWFVAKAFPLKDFPAGKIKWFGVSTDVHKTKVSELRALSIQELSASLLRSTTKEEVIKAIIAEGTKALGADAMAISWKVPSTQYLDLVGSLGYPEEITMRYARVSIDDDLPASACVREKQIMYYSHANAWSSDKPKKDLTTAFSARANIPLFQGDEVVGVITFSFREPQDFDTDFRMSVKVIADEFNQAIERAYLALEQELYAKKVIELQMITSELSKAKTEPEVMNVISQYVFTAFEADAGILSLPTVNNEALSIEIFKGFPVEFPTNFKVTSVQKKTVAARTFLSGTPYFYISPEEILEHCPDSVPLVNTNFKSLACLPLNVNHGCLGIIFFAYLKTRPFPETTRNLMVTLASYSAEALERSRLFDISERAVKARDNMISISAHELITPVSGIKLKLQVLRKKLEKGQEVSKEDLLKLTIQTDNNLNRLSKLVNDMLDISRINHGKLTLQSELINLSQVLTQMIDGIELQTKTAKCTLTYSIEPDIYIYGDAYRFEQIVTNLISNSCRYASGKPVHLSLKKDESQVKLTVEDQGIGIKKEDQRRIFERFERATTLNENTGLGLGLFIVKQIVDAHHGRISLDSDHQKGAKFKISLPLYSESL